MSKAGGGAGRQGRATDYAKQYGVNPSGGPVTVHVYNPNMKDFVTSFHGEVTIDANKFNEFAKNTLAQPRVSITKVTQRKPTPSWMAGAKKAGYFR